MIGVSSPMRQSGCLVHANHELLTTTNSCSCPSPVRYKCDGLMTSLCSTGAFTCGCTLLTGCLVEWQSMTLLTLSVFVGAFGGSRCIVCYPDRLPSSAREHFTQAHYRRGSIRTHFNPNTTMHLTCAVTSLFRSLAGSFVIALTVFLLAGLKFTSRDSHRQDRRCDNGQRSVASPATGGACQRLHLLRSCRPCHARCPAMAAAGDPH